MQLFGPHGTKGNEMQLRSLICFTFFDLNTHCRSDYNKMNLIAPKQCFLEMYDCQVNNVHPRYCITITNLPLPLLAAPASVSTTSVGETW